VIWVIWLYILISVVILSWYSFTYRHFTIQLFFVYNYHVISWLSVYTCCYYHIISYLFSVICTYCLYVRAPSLLRTHSLGRFDGLGFARPDTEYFMLLFRCSLSSYASRGVWSFSHSDSGILVHFYSCYFLFLPISHPVVISFLFHVIAYVDIYM